MFEKLKNIWLKFNKKENKEEKEKKKKSKLTSVIGMLLFTIVSSLVLDYIGVFDTLFVSNSFSSSPSASLTTKTLREDFVIEDFIYENYLSKREDESIMNEGLKEVYDYYMDFINDYNTFPLLDANGQTFTLKGNDYVYENLGIKYIYNPTYESITLEAAAMSVKYTNKNNVIKVECPSYEVLLEGTTLSFKYDNKEVIFELFEDDFALTYNEGQIIEHYSKDTCSLIYYESSIENHLYNTYVYEEIKNDTTLEYDEQEITYKINGEEAFNFNFELDVPNYYVMKAYLFNAKGETKHIMMVVILQSYEVENGLPFNLSR